MVVTTHMVPFSDLRKALQRRFWGVVCGIPNSGRMRKWNTNTIKFRNNLHYPVADPGEGPGGPELSPLFWVKTKKESQKEEEPASRISTSKGQVT